MLFPYEKLENLVAIIKGGKSFLTPHDSIILNKEELEALIAVCNKYSDAEERMDFINGEKITPNQKLILLHAYWLWTYPFGFDGERKFNELFASYNNIVRDHVTYKECLSSMGGYPQLMHKEMMWILQNVFSLIIETPDFDTFKAEYITAWSSNTTNVSTKNLLLHILDRENFESIAKQDDKDKINAANSGSLFFIFQSPLLIIYNHIHLNMHT